jgi:hypothetical protein
LELIELELAMYIRGKITVMGSARPGGALPRAEE